MHLIGLRRNGRLEQKQQRRFPLKIDLGRVQAPLCCSNFTTPYSMLSPKSPKLKPVFLEPSTPAETETPTGKADDCKEDCDSILHLIDLTSPLGQRIASTIRDLITDSYNMCSNYEWYCKLTSEETSDDHRVLRSFRGKTLEQVWAYYLLLPKRFAAVHDIL